MLSATLLKSKDEVSVDSDGNDSDAVSAFEVVTPT